MFKLGRGGGGGRGPAKRPLISTGPSRPSSGPTGGRLGGRTGGPAVRASASTPVGKDESFSLVTKEAVDFGAIIRLTPDLVEEIRRIESQGGSAKIKFDYQSSAENVIDVGGKEFRFTWSREPGHLCDIYEEHESGEDGEGLLVERGSAWRKLDVNRILDESTKHHVKMRSEEAERLSKSRKVHLLDHTNPAIKHQVRSMAAAAVDGSMRRMNWKQKKEPFNNKRKVEPNQGLKSSFKVGVSSNRSTKSRPSVSPLSSPFEQTPPAASILAKGEETTPTFNVEKEHIDIGNFEKEIPSGGIYGAKGETSANKGGIGNQTMDLQSILVNLLSQNPKGMSIKALEKAVGQTIPNAGRKIESVIKNIATYHTPGRYLLKPGLEVESSVKVGSENGSSPDSAPNHVSFESLFGEEELNGNNNHQDQFGSKGDEELLPSKTVDVVQDDPDPFSNGKKLGHDSSDSGSDSDSESDSSDSGSDSRSKSKSPMGSGSVSSSDSESDGSSSSKEGSDVHVDIISEDEKEQIDIIGRDEEGQIASSPIDLNAFGKTDSVEIDVVDNKVLPADETKVDLNMNYDQHEANSMFPEAGTPFSRDRKELFDKKSSNEKKSAQIDMSSQQQTEKNHKSKSKRAAQPAEPLTGRNNAEFISPEKLKQDEYKLNNSDSSADRGRSIEYGNMQKSLQSPDLRRSLNFDSDQMGGRTNDLGGRKRSFDRISKNTERVSSFPDLNMKDKTYNNIVKKSGDNAGILKNKGPPSQMKNSVQGANLRRELSDLELGEFREPPSNDIGNLVKSTELDQVKGLGHHSGSQKKMSDNFVQTGKNAKESKSKKSNSLGDSTHRNSNNVLTDTDVNGRKRKESPYDTDDSFYSKYDKEEPDIRGPIKDYMQYKEYLQEYNEKYKCYISLNKNLEKIRDIFTKIGEDLELSKGRDREEYYKATCHLKEMYRHHGQRNKQMKKVFILLHEELKTLKQRIQEFADTYAKG